MKEQLNKLMEAEGLTPAKFADEIGVQRSSISHIISGRNKPSYDFITKILSRFNGINAEWLLTGNGSMIKGQETLHIPPKQADSLFSNPIHSKPEESLENKNITQTNSNKSTRGESEDHVTTQQPNNITNKKLKTHEFTNVNNVKYILVFYEDGSFEQYNPRN